MKKIFIISLIATSLFSDTLIKTNPVISSLPNIDIKEFVVPDNIGDPTKESLPLFSVSCNNIKYTGAYEQTFINMLEDSKVYIKEVIRPYTTLKKMDAAIYTYAFGSCLQSIAKKEITGDATHSSLLQKAKEASGEARNSVIIKSGVSSSAQGSVNAEIETDVKINLKSTASKIAESSGEEGMFSDVVRCIMDEREKAYLKLYNILSYSLKMKYVVGSAVNSACNVPLKQEGEVIPSWAKLTGMDFKKYNKELFGTDSSDSKVGKFTKEYFSEVFSFDVSTSSEICKKWNPATGVCEDSIKIEREECRFNDKGFLIGGCNCVQGINILTGKTCGTAEDYNFNKIFGKNTDYTNVNSANNIDLSLGENIFIKTLANSSYYDSKIPYNLFFDNDIILIKWNVYLGRDKGFISFRLNTVDNFKIEMVNFKDRSLRELDTKTFLLRTDNKAIIYASDFATNLLSFLALNSVKTEQDKANFIKEHYIPKANFKEVINKFNKIKDKYRSTFDFLDNAYKFYPNEINFKKKEYNVKKALKNIFNSDNINRMVVFQNDFKNVFLLKARKMILSLELSGSTKKDIFIAKNFTKNFFLNFPDTSEFEFKKINEQLYNIANQSFKDKQTNLNFMELNTEINYEKSSLVKTIYN